MATSVPRCVVIALVLFAAACGDDAVTDTGAPPATEFGCDERTSFHGDPAPDTTGSTTPEEAIATAAADYGVPSLASESGDRSTWNVHDGEGNLVGVIEIGPAPAGGFIAGDHELCADAVDHDEEGDEIVGPPAEPSNGPAVDDTIESAFERWEQAAVRSYWMEALVGPSARRVRGYIVVGEPWSGLEFAETGELVANHNVPLAFVGDLTVDGLLVTLADAFERGYEVTAGQQSDDPPAYDETWGYPLSFWVDPDPDVEGDEYGVSDVEVEVEWTGVAPDGALPDREAWAAEHPRPDEGVPVHLVVDFSVGEGFEPVDVVIEIDGDEVVSGAGWHRPWEHCNWWGAYEMILASGAHTVDVQTSDGLELTDTFEVASEATALVNYTHGTYSGGTEPKLRWELFDGTPGCD